MIILDTHIVSEVIDPAPPEDVVRRFGALPGKDPFTTTITEAELFYGAARFAASRP